MTEGLLDKGTFDKYAAALKDHANLQADKTSQELQELLASNEIPFSRIMARASHQDGHSLAEFVIVLDGDESPELERRVFEVAEELQTRDSDPLVTGLHPISATSPTALEPEHYFPGYRVTFPPVTRA